MGRAPCCDKSSVKKGHWSPEEDKQLKEYIEKHGTGGNWITLPHKAGLNRCGKSCRLRWLNYLKPNIKHGCFSDDEDRIIANLYASIGSRWSVIASHLPGRTDNDIKNYWNTKLKKKFSGMIRPHPKRIKRVNRHHHDQQQQQQQQEYSYGFPSSSDSSDPLLLSSPIAAFLLSSLTNGNAAGTGNPMQHLPAAPVQYSSFNPMESWGGDQDASSCLGLETFFYGGGGDGAAADAALVELNLEEYADHLIPSANAGYGSTAGWISEDGEYGDAALREAAARAMLDPEEQRAPNTNSAIRSWRGCSYDSIAHVSSSALW